MTVAEQTLSRRIPASRGGGAGTGAVWWLAGLVTLGVAMVVATYGGREATVIGMLVASVFMVFVLAKPEVGVLLLMTNYLIASYPTPLRGQGLLTINNILGIILAVILIARLAQRPDFWFLRVRQLHIFLAIGVVFGLSTLAAAYQFPDLQVTSGRFRLLDQTAPMARAFATRVAFIILAMSFLTTKRHIKMAMALIMICLIMVVPSAILGWAGGKGIGGYRAAAQFSLGTNSNRLAFLCLMQMAFWWYYMRAERSTMRSVVSTGVLLSLIFTVFLTASRSGVIGLGILFVMLGRRTTGGGNRLQVLAVALLAIGLLVTLIPAQNLERMQDLNPFAEGNVTDSSHSTERRVQTVEVAWDMYLDYPLFGVGLGNFREVARQVYRDPYWRPPHNSYMWALSEGGTICFLLYLSLFALTWRDIRRLQASPALPADMRWLPSALEPALALLLFYSIFADIWLSPITYIVIMMVVIMRRYVGLRQAAVA